MTPDVFEVIDWPGIFGVKATPLTEALRRDLPRTRAIRRSCWSSDGMARVVVIGAGAMGLAAAYHALKPAIR